MSAAVRTSPSPQGCESVAAPRRPLALRVLSTLASLRLTLVCLLLLTAAVAYIYDRAGEGSATLPLVLPLTLLAVNLFAAIATNAVFRRQLPLLVFHLALLGIVVLTALGRMTYLRATTEVAVGGEFERMQNIEAGPWHNGAKERLRFQNLGFEIAYKPGVQRDRTVNRVRWRDAAGIPHESEIGDQVPLVLEGYRFYTTSNKGFAALFEWQPAGGEAHLGNVNFPSYPFHADKQNSRWSIDGTELSAQLVFDEVLIEPSAESRFRLPGRHEVVVQAGLRERRLQPGDGMFLGRGRLTYVGLTTWMGYGIFYDWTIPWLLSACVLATAALGWHFWRKFAARPWKPC